MRSFAQGPLFLCSFVVSSETDETYRGLDAIGRVWDLRSGRTAMVLDGHVKDILAIDFSPNGFVLLCCTYYAKLTLRNRHQIATGSNDDTVRIWDMRSLKSIYTIPAHKSSVSDVKFFRSTPSSLPTLPIPRAFAKLPVFNISEDVSTSAERDPTAMEDVKEAKKEGVDVPLSGSFLVTSGYDGYVRIWSADDWQLIKSMTSDAGGKVMSVDVSSGQFFVPSFVLSRRARRRAEQEADECDTIDGRFLASGEYARTYKLWSSPDVDLS